MHDLVEKRFTTPTRLLIALAFVLVPVAAEAYVGPGAGLSLLGALWGVLCAIGAAFLFVIMWPIRRLRRRRREARQAESARPDATPTQQRANQDSSAADKQTRSS